jgi:hypothetical protein
MSKVAKFPDRTAPVDAAQDKQQAAVEALLDVARKMIAEREFKDALPDDIVDTIADEAMDATFAWQADLIEKAVALADASFTYGELLDAEQAAAAGVN